MTCQVDKLIEDLACQMGDPGYERWTIEKWMSYLQSAVLYVSARARDDLATTKEVTLNPGSCFTELCDQCEDIVGFLGQVGNECDVVETPSSSRINVFQHYADFCDNAEGEYEITEWSILSDGCTLRVKPETPQNREIKVKIRCYDTPDITDLDGVLDDDLCKFLPAIRTYMLHLAYGLNASSPDSFQRSQQHFQEFRLILDDLVVAGARVQNNA